MKRVRMGRLADLPVGGVLEKQIMARRVAVFNVAGKLYGIQSDCKHMRAPLGSGTVKDRIITCKWHHWRYDLETGECLDQKSARLQRYDVKIEHGEIFLEV